MCKALSNCQRSHIFVLSDCLSRALEERRKQWDVHEKRLRENILQQRHQRVQDATENFQRAHLPPSQRKRQGKFSETALIHALFIS